MENRYNIERIKVSVITFIFLLTFSAALEYYYGFVFEKTSQMIQSQLYESRSTVMDYLKKDIRRQNSTLVGLYNSNKSIFKDSEKSGVYHVIMNHHHNE